MITLDDGASLAWRWRHHGLDSPLAAGVVVVAERVLAARAWPLPAAEEAFAVRQADPQAGAVESALRTGELIQSYAFRGGSYVFTPEIGAVLMAVRTTSRAWESRRWQRQIVDDAVDWEALRAAVREALASGPATRAEIASHLAGARSVAQLAEAAATGAGADSLYKPLHWWGDICFGPPRQGQSTFRWLRDDPHWPGLPDADDAGRLAVRQYLRAYGPATEANLSYWLTEGLSAPRSRVAGWLADLGDEVSAVTVAGVHAYVLTETLDDLQAAQPSDALKLLPAYDPWVMGPGTADSRIVPPERRRLLSNGAAALVRGGRVVGTWRLQDGATSVSWFEE
ncbi:DNA glycosylase AlkZ-like family protein [Pseudactinotalea terrae]|uniref:DNA glycosylase AlkZ-like family protein n=1 Tax=Pseudactinotalea terrae TaxID=1743262 RepID=UPI0012E17BD1|nr:crosslink repair DNA glycosylase YcaQ family protein [Pseudactinotalea terrae]